ncbi:MAG: nitroreductase/quinone reductase family protein [Acidimicrobiales bacterium]
MASTPIPHVPKIASWVNERTKGRPTPVALLRFHRWLYLTSGGRAGHGLIGAPCLVLTTRGRRSHALRETVLVYARDGDRYVVAASNDGLNRDPSWLFNVRTDPIVQVQVGRRHLRGIASVVEHTDPVFSHLWSEINAINHDRYNGYQAMTPRQIPLVTIETSDSHVPNDHL